MLLGLVLLLFQAGQPLPVLNPGAPLEGEVTEASPVVETPALKKSYTDAPVLGETFAFQVPASGPWHLDLRSYFFDAYLVLRDGEGKLLAEDDDGLIGLHSRIVAKLKVGELYSVTACALHGARGAFDLRLEPGRPGPLSPREQAQAGLAEAKARLKAMEGTFGPDDLQTGAALTHLGFLYWRSGRYARALPMMQRAFEIAQAHYGGEDPRTADALFQVAAQLEGLSRWKEARTLFERVLAIREKVLGPGHPDTAGALEQLGGVFKDQGLYEKARPFYERALAIKEKVLGPEAPEIAFVLNNLAGLLKDQGEYEAARPLYERALRIFQKTSGSEAPETATALNNLASLLTAMGHKEEARPLYERALAIWEETLGPEHPNTAAALNNLAGLLKGMGFYEEARPLYERALAIWMKVSGPEDPKTAFGLGNLGSLLRSEGRYQEARPLLERALAIDGKALGPDHPQTAIDLKGLARLLQDQGLYSEARSLLERTLAIREKALGLEHPDTATSLNDLAVLLQAQGHYQEARPLYERALEIREKVLGPGHPDTAISLNDLALLLRIEGRYEEAQPLLERALAINEKILGPQNPGTSRVLNNLGVVLCNQGHYEEAQRLYRRALDVEETVLGPDRPETETTLRNLAVLLLDQRRYEEALPLFERVLRNTLAHLDRELPTMPEAERFRLLAVSARPYRLLANAAHLAKKPGAGVLALCQKWKGKATRLEQAGLKLAHEKDSRQVQDRIGEIQGLQKELSTQVFLPLSKRGKDHEERVAALRRKRIELEGSLHAALGLDEVLATPTVAEVQAALPADAVLLDFYAGKEVFAWVVHREGAPVLVRLGEAEVLRKAQEELLHRTAVRGAAPLRGEDPKPGEELRALLWGPVAGLVGDARTVLVSPDGFLGELPFGILPDGEGRFLIEKHRFAYLSDATRIVEGDGPAADREGSVLAVGDVNYYRREGTRFGPALAMAAPHSRSRIGDTWPSLEATREELRGLRDLHDLVLEWKSPFDQLDGQGATEEAVRAALPGHRYLHLATHGFFEPENLPSLVANAENQAGGTLGEERRAVGLLPGLLSGLVLAGVNGEPDPGREDGYLSAEEIQYLDLTACHLAVLSACETALGSPRAGEGLQSLRRGFAVAGAKTVVSSLWKVSDEATAALMRRFYENYWRKGMEKLEALHEARLWLLRRNRAEYQGDARPSTWGAFVLSGDWR